MADSPVLYVYYRPDNDDAYPGVPNRHITEADWARFSPSQRRTVEQATTQEGYTRRKVWLHRDLVDETEQERADREAAEQAAREAYERGQSIVRWRDFEPLVPGPGEVIVGSEDGPVAVDAATVGGEVDPASIGPAIETKLADGVPALKVGADLVVTRDDGNAGQRFSLTGSDDSVMPYFQVVASTRTGTDGGAAVAGYQLHLGPDTGGGINREFFYIEAAGERHPDGPHFRFGDHASGAGVRRPLRWENGGTSAIITDPVAKRLRFYQEIALSGGVSNPITMDADGATARTIIRGTSYSDILATPMQIFLGSSGGTPTAPTAPTSGKQLGSLQFGARDSATRVSAHIRGVATQNWAFGTAHGTRVEILTVPNGSASPVHHTWFTEPAANQVGIMIRVNRNGTITQSQVTIGEPDSGGTGYRVLRVAN